MKELNIEEKAKAYDEAKARMSKAYNDNRCTIGFMNEIFPELKESEDERIRKELIFYFQEEIPQCSIQEHADKMKEFIAWLEKQGEITKEWSEMKINRIQTELQEMVDLKQKTEQGEQNPVDKIQLGKKYKCIASPRYSTFRIGEIYKPEDKFLCSLMNFCSDCFEPIEDEQKPAYTKEYDFHGIKFIPKFAKGDIIKDKKCGEVSTIEDFSYDTGLYTHTYGQFPITIQDNYEIIAQKPAWSEEDVVMLNKLLAVVKLYYDRDGDDLDKQSCISYLKSLKDRVQPKYALSEEDEAVLDALTRRLEGEDIHVSPHLAVKCLKSLKLRATWKPSDEQIKVCKEVYADLLSAKGFDLGTVNSELNRMEEELKKPMEE